MRHDQRSEEWSGDTRDRPRAAGRAQRPAAFVRRINHSEQNKRKSGHGSRSDALDGASADELHHCARDGAKSAPDGERDNADEICAPASPAIGARSPDRHRYRRGEHVSGKCPRVEVGTAKLGQRHRHHRADDCVVETGENDGEQHTEQDQHAALSGGILRWHRSYCTCNRRTSISSFTSSPFQEDAGRFCETETLLKMILVTPGEPATLRPVRIMNLNKKLFALALGAPSGSARERALKAQTSLDEFYPVFCRWQPRPPFSIRRRPCHAWCPNSSLTWRDHEHGDARVIFAFSEPRSDDRFPKLIDLLLIARDAGLPFRTL